MAVIAEYRSTWFFARRVRLGVETEKSLAFLRNIASSNDNLKVRKFAKTQIMQLQFEKSEMELERN